MSGVGRLSRALLAEPDDREVSEACVKAELFSDQVADGVEVRDVDSSECLAAFAVEVFGVLPSGEDVEAGTVGEVDVVDGAEPFEQLEVAIDRGGVKPQLARELLG